MSKLSKIGDGDYQAALSASAAAPRKPWQLSSISFDGSKNRIVMGFNQGIELAIPVSFIEEFAGAAKKDLRGIYLTPAGDTVVVEAVDAHVSARGLIEAAFAALPSGIFAAKLGAAGGARSSAAKKASSAENGKKGGRPKKGAAKAKAAAQSPMAAEEASRAVFGELAGRSATLGGGAAKMSASEARKARPRRAAEANPEIAKRRG